jgi:rhodanese-related sulfurtransferase
MPSKEISANEAFMLIEREDVGIIDVREPAEHMASHIEGSESFPLSKLKGEDIKHGKSAYIIYCQKGSRGKSACEKLLAHNPDLNIYNISGGINEWVNEGYNVRKGDKSILPLDRQVQLSISTLLLAFCALSLTISTAFIWPIIFIATGLFVAGATGFCGLARVIALMPWNQRV